MNTRKDEQWLDGELRRVINTSKPEFDADAWKSTHVEAYQTLLSRRRHSRAHGTPPHALRRLLASFRGGLAVAAAFLVVTGLVFVVTRPQADRPPFVPPVAEPPEGAVTLMSLTLAYRHGGEEAFNRRLDTALETLGPRPDPSLLTDVLKDLEG